MELNYSKDFEQLLAAFEYIRSLKSPLHRRFVLNRSAGYWGLPRSEARKMFELYCSEYAAEEVGNNG